MSDAAQRRGATVDLNSDVGEGFGPWRMGDDEALLRIVTTANIACGLHAGDPAIMRRTVGLAAENGVRVGAHPGPDDLRGFGRRSVAGERAEDLAVLVAYQVGALRAVAALEGATLTHVKLHGSLSTAAALDAELAGAIAEALRDVDPAIAWLVPAGSAMSGAAERHGLRAVSEVFADRAYGDDGALVPRSRPGSVLAEPAAIAARAVEMAAEGAVMTVSGRRLPVAVESICVHGDTPGAVAAAAGVRQALEAAGVEVRPFA